MLITVNMLHRVLAHGDARMYVAGGAAVAPECAGDIDLWAIPFAVPLIGTGEFSPPISTLLAPTSAHRKDGNNDLLHQ